MALKNLKSNKSKKNGKFNDDEGFPKMKASPKGKEKVTKSKWKDYEPQEDEDDE